MSMMEEKVGLYVASFCTACIMLGSYLTSIFCPSHPEVKAAVLMGPQAKDGKSCDRKLFLLVKHINA